jgi:PKD repeat protein
LLPIIILLSFLSSCEREPYADFYTSHAVAEVYEIINFYNTSDYYDYVEWDFGDGTFSTNLNPSHHYSNPGIYTVTLTVFGENEEIDRAFMNIEVTEFYVGFNVSGTPVEQSELVYFTNLSSTADFFEWSFGDGTISNAANPSHSYNNYGNYLVTLEAFRNNILIGTASTTIEVLFPTTLEITVLEYYEEYPVPDASIILYPSLYDWENEINPILDSYGNVLEGITNESGVVTFTGLNPVSYWIDVWHINHNNYLLAGEDENFIKTLPLKKNQVNSFIAYVDHVASKSTKEGRKISKFKTTKLQRTLKEKQMKNIQEVK